MSAKKRHETPPGKPSRRVDWNARESIFTDAEVQEALMAIRGRLRRSGHLTFRGFKLTKETAFAVLVLWADAQPVEVLEDLLAPFVAKLESLVERSARKKAPDAPASGEVGKLTSKTVTRPRRPRKRNGSDVDPQLGREIL